MNTTVLKFKFSSKVLDMHCYFVDLLGSLQRVCDHNKSTNIYHNVLFTLLQRERAVFFVGTLQANDA